MRQLPSRRHQCQRSRRVYRQKTISSPLGNTRYYICPGCGIFLEREFVHYCDSCGQKLNWRLVAAQFKKADSFL